MDMYPEHGLGRSLLTALNTIGRESGHPELGNAKLIVLGFSGKGAYFGHFVAYSPDRVLAAILANPGANDPDKLDQNGVAVPELIIVGGVDTISGTAKPYNVYHRYRPKGVPWVYLVQNKIPHCCINDTKSAKKRKCTGTLDPDLMTLGNSFPSSQGHPCPAFIAQSVTTSTTTFFDDQVVIMDDGSTDRPALITN